MASHRIAAPFGLLACVGVLATTNLSAQTFTACRVPDVGAIYMIGVSGAPSACLDPSHVEFSWTEGGELADTSVTTSKIAEGAVTTSKIAAGAVGFGQLATGSVGTGTIIDGAVGAADIGANAVGASEIQANAVGASEIQANAVGASELGLEVVSASASTSSSSASLTAQCSAGKRVISGGYYLDSVSGASVHQMEAYRNAPASGATWYVAVSWETAPTSWSWTVYAICVEG